MGALSSPSLESTVADAVAVGRAAGLRVEEPTVLRQSLNVLVWLRPAAVVARVQAGTALVRTVEALDDSLALAQFLVQAGLPVGPPADEVDPGPHIGPTTGQAMTLWRHLDLVDEPVDPVAVGRSLAELHAVAAGYVGPLRHVGPLAEIERLIEVARPVRPGLASRLREYRRRIEVPEGPVQALHGDSHLANVVATRDGLRWLDWEESWRGPVAWDLASMEHRHVVFGELSAEIGAAMTAYGRVDRAAVDAWQPVVALWAAAWGIVGAGRGELGDGAIRRLAWLDERLG